VTTLQQLAARTLFTIPDFADRSKRNDMTRELTELACDERIFPFKNVLASLLTDGFSSETGLNAFLASDVNAITLDPILFT